MAFSVNSLVMAVLWSSIFALLSYIVMKRDGFISYSVFSLILLLILGLMRLLLTVEFSFAQVIRSEVIYNHLYRLVTYSIAEIAGVQITVGILLVFVWITVALILFIKELRSYNKELGTLQQFAARCDPADEALLDQIVTDKKKRDRLRVLRVEEIGIPIIAGIRKPIIYLPDYEFNITHLTGILTHESAHYRHKDNLIRIIVRTMSAFFWWNPLIHLLKNNLHQATEIRADQDVKAVFSEEEREIYLDCINQLIEIYHDRMRVSSSFAGFISMNHRKNLEQRFAVMRDNRNRKRRNLVITIGLYVVMLVLLFLSYTFVVQPYFRLPNEEELYEPDVNNRAPQPFGIVGKEGDDNYLIDNGDGTYAMYINGVFIKNITNIYHEALSSFEIREASP